VTGLTLCSSAERGDAYFIYLAYLHSMDAGDEQAAAAYMRRLIAGMPEENPSPYYSCEAVYWLAMFGSQAEDAAKWMNRVGEQPIDPETRLRAEAALAFANGQSERAITLAKEALSLISDQPATGSSEYAADRLRYLLNTLERQPTEPVSVNR